MNPILYEKDYYLWLEETAQFLQDGRLAELDVENLLDEIQAMARSEKRALAKYRNKINYLFPVFKPSGQGA